MHDTYGLAERYKKETLDINTDAVWFFLIGCLVTLLIFAALIAKGAVLLAWIVGPALIWANVEYLARKLGAQ